jgi:hypothetical protein
MERERQTRRERDRKHRSQPGLRKGPTNSSYGSLITDEEEDSIASRNKRRRKRNNTQRRLLADQQQDDDDGEENYSYVY